MSLSAFNFQFYNYKMPSYKDALVDSSSNDSMDVEMTTEVEVHMPVCSLVSSTPKVNAVTNSNEIQETPKGIFKAADNNVQLRKRLTNNALETSSLPCLKPPAEHHNPKRWSCELREKALEMAKRSSGSDEEIPQQNQFMQRLQENCSVSSLIKSQDGTFSFENPASSSSSSKPSTAVKSVLNVSLGSTMEMNTIFDFSQLTAQADENTSADFERILNDTHLSKVETNENKQQSCANKSITKPTEKLIVEEHLAPVKERICFFNKLTGNDAKPKYNSKFINMLKTTKDVAAATVNNSINNSNISLSHSTNSLPNAMLPPPPKPKRLNACSVSAQRLFNFGANSTNSSLTNFANFTNFTQSQDCLTLNSNSSNSTTTTTSATPITFSSLQRKSSLRRKPSLNDKSRCSISRQNSSAGSAGNTKPQMHAVMEDLSLVIPVRLRVAEYERRIMMEC